MGFPWVSHGFPMVEAAPGVDHLGWLGAGWRHFAGDSLAGKNQGKAGQVNGLMGLVQGGAPPVMFVGL